MGVVLSNPPLVETAFCVEMCATPLVDCDYAGLAQRVAPDFLERSPIFDSQVRVDVAHPEQTVVTDRKCSGIRCKKDDHLVVTLRERTPGRYGFAFSMLKPYTSWEDFSKTAGSIYDGVIKVVKPSKIMRLGVRSVDRLPVPDEAREVTDVLRTIPPDPVKVGNVRADEFFYRDTAFYADFNLYATVIRVYKRGRANGQDHIILDSDIYATPEKIMSEAEFKEMFVKVRRLKNEIFFGSIGSVALEACK